MSEKGQNNSAVLVLSVFVLGPHIFESFNKQQPASVLVIRNLCCAVKCRSSLQRNLFQVIAVIPDFQRHAYKLWVNVSKTYEKTSGSLGFEYFVHCKHQIASVKTGQADDKLIQK